MRFGYYRDNFILLFGILLFLTLSILIFKGSFINLEKVEKIDKKVVRIFETTERNPGERGSPFSKLAFELEGVNQILTYYNLFDDYDRIKQVISTNSFATFYYKPSSKKFNPDVFQIEANGLVVVNKSIFELRERVGAVILFLAAVGLFYWGRRYIKDRYKSDKHFFS